MPRPLPPYASGSARPSQPSWAMSFHMASLTPRGSSISARTTAGLQCSSRKARAALRTSCWSGLNAKSTVASLRLHPVGAYFLGQAEHALADDVLLDLGGAGIDGAGPGPEKRVGPGAALTGRGVDVEAEFLRGPRHELTEGPEDLLHQLLIPLFELAVGKLGDGRKGAR